MKGGAIRPAISSKHTHSIMFGDAPGQSDSRVALIDDIGLASRIGHGSGRAVVTFLCKHHQGFVLDLLQRRRAVIPKPGHDYNAEVPSYGSPQGTNSGVDTGAGHVGKHVRFDRETVSINRYGGFALDDIGVPRP